MGNNNESIELANFLYSTKPGTTEDGDAIIWYETEAHDYDCGIVLPKPELRLAKYCLVTKDVRLSNNGFLDYFKDEVTEDPCGYSIDWETNWQTRGWAPATARFLGHIAADITDTIRFSDGHNMYGKFTPRSLDTNSDLMMLTGVDLPSSGAMYDLLWLNGANETLAQCVTEDMDEMMLLATEI